MTDSAASPDNAAFLEQLLAAYQEDPSRVSQEWKAYFERLAEPDAPAPKPDARTKRASAGAEKQAAVLRLINVYRFRGHRQARLDPLGLYERPPVPDLDPAFHDLTEADLDSVFNTGSLVAPREATLREILSIVRTVYCGPIGAEYMYITSPEQKRWIRQRLEGPRGKPAFPPQKKRDILRWITAANKLEEYLHKKYVGQKRFSLEGGESLIPLLDELIQSASAKHDAREIVIGMAHRGRLNVLVNVFGKSPKSLFSEFEGRSASAAATSGDVKYHLGFSSDVATANGHAHIVLAFNPSHLEIIDPVVEGSVRARQDRRRDFTRSQVLPMLIHGDASFAGQGVVMETLNLSETRGFGTGGTVHVIVNNQIGFTTSDPLDSRSTLYCTDVAKMVQAPIFHVNGDDPEAVLFVTQLALDFRMEFKKDVVIDMVCYRRHGHNEADEPLATQPMMYTKIKEKENVRRLYAERLIAEGVIDQETADAVAREYLSDLEANRVVSRPLITTNKGEYLADWKPYVGTHWTEQAHTAVSVETVERLGTKIASYPEDFELHRSVARIMEARREMAEGIRPIDWGFAENLAYATLLEDGYSVRLSGQDSERGTFFHRHAVLHNQKRRGVYEPLHHLFDGQPRFRVINSLLSEEAVLAFEYGYSTAEPECLTVWEAQFGDFANGAQVVIDQFLSSSEAKWGRYCGLVLLLPHGYDGQGPEHSSARLERFLQLAAEDNFQVCVPSTPAQMFHMLRREMRRAYRKPLVVMSPKSLLRHRLSTAKREELATGGFQTVIGEIDELNPKGVTRLVFCSGKVYYDLIEQRRKDRLKHVAIARIEQLYPFPREGAAAVFARYPNAQEVVWAQEEPTNQGAWDFVSSRRHLAGLLNPRQTLSYASRPYSAAPAVGNVNIHLEQQRTLVSEALALGAVEETQQQTA